MKAKFPISSCSATGRRQAFTLVELLVIIGILVVLAMFQVGALASARNRSKVAMCASNVRQLTVASHLYASENKEKLPVLAGPAAWAWDLSWDVGNNLLSYDLQKRTFYCPGTAPRFTDWDNFQNPTPNANLWDFSPQSIHVAGYMFAFSGNGSLLIQSNRNTTILAEPAKTGTIVPILPPPPNSERVLIADATLSNATGVYEQRYTYNYANIAGGFYKPHTSPHLRGVVPDGCNLGFKDGHVAWRKFDDMYPRTTGGPSFWW